MDNLETVAADLIESLQAELAVARTRAAEMEAQRDDYLNREWVATKAKLAAEQRLRELTESARKVYDQIPQMPIDAETADAATDAFMSFCFLFHEELSGSGSAGE